MLVLCVGGANFTSNGTAAMATPNLSLLLSANGALPTGTAMAGCSVELILLPLFRRYITGLVADEVLNDWSS